MQRYSLITAMFVSVSAAIGLSGCTVTLDVPERTVLYPDQPPKIDLPVELVLSEEFRNTHWEMKLLGKQIVPLGEVLAANAESLAKRVFSEVTVNDEASETNRKATLTPTVNFVSRTRPVWTTGTQETAIVLEWVLNDRKGNLVWVETVTGVGKGGVDSIDDQIHPLIDDLFLKSFREIASSVEVGQFVASGQ